MLKPIGPVLARVAAKAKPAAEMTQGQVLSYREWPAHLTVDQMRSQIAWEQSPDFKLHHD